MSERHLITQKAEAFFEELWKRGDPWELETSEFEHAKYTRQLTLLDGCRYGRVLEIGCGAGRFTRLLASLSDQVIALDISPTAVARARAAVTDGADFRVANIMDYDLCAEGPWDLIVMSETIYYLGWLYSFFDVAWLASELFASTREEGKLLLVNTQGELEDSLVRPWLIRSYRDLFLNVGYQLGSEEVFSGQKNGADLEVLISLFVRRPSG